MVLQWYCTTLVLRRYTADTALVLNMTRTGPALVIVLELCWYCIAGAALVPRGYCANTVLVLHWCRNGAVLVLFGYHPGAALVRQWYSHYYSTNSDPT